MIDYYEPCPHCTNPDMLAQVEECKARGLTRSQAAQELKWTWNEMARHWPLSKDKQAEIDAREPRREVTPETLAEDRSAVEAFLADNAMGTRQKFKDQQGWTWHRVNSVWTKQEEYARDAGYVKRILEKYPRATRKQVKDYLKWSDRRIQEHMPVPRRNRR